MTPGEARLEAALSSIEARLARLEGSPAPAPRESAPPRESSPPRAPAPEPTAVERRKRIEEALGGGSPEIVDEWIRVRGLAAMDRLLAGVVSTARRKAVRRQVLGLLAIDPDEEAWNVLSGIRARVLADAVDGKHGVSRLTTART